MSTGCWVIQDAVNFSVFSSAATSLALCLFTEADLQAGRVTHEVALDPDLNRTGDVWHIMLPQLHSKLLYGEPAGSPLCVRIAHAELRTGQDDVTL